MSKNTGCNLNDQLTILSQFGIYSFLSYQNRFEIMNKISPQWMDLTAFLPESIVKNNEDFMVYFCDKIPLIFSNTQIQTFAGQILLNNVQSVIYNNLSSEISESQSALIIQQNNKYFGLQLNYDEQYQINVELTETENVKQPECLTFTTELEWENFLQKTVGKYIETVYNREFGIIFDAPNQFWNFYTDVMHPKYYVTQSIELTLILNEISLNSIKNIENAVKYLKTVSNYLVERLDNIICQQTNIFNFVFSNLYEVMVEIFNKNNFYMLQIIRMLLKQNRIDETLKIINESQRFQAYDEFLKHLCVSDKDRSKVSLAQYQQIVSKFHLLLQHNLADFDFLNYQLMLFTFHLFQYGTQQINVSFDSKIKLYIGRQNTLKIPDYATLLQVAILFHYNDHVGNFISQQNEVSQLGLTCFQIAIMGGNTEMVVKFQCQLQIQTYHITSLMLLMTTYTQKIPDQILEKLIQLQAGMITKHKQCALQEFLYHPKPIPLKCICAILEKEFKLLTFDSIQQFMTFLSLKQFHYINQINFVDGICISEAILFTMIQHDTIYQAFQFISSDIKRNTRFRPVCAKFITHKHINLLFQHFSFSLSHDMLFLGVMILSQTNLKPIESCLRNSQNILRGFSCYDFAINLMKIQQTKDFKKVDYFFKPLVMGDSFEGLDVFSRNALDHLKLCQFLDDQWEIDIQRLDLTYSIE
ncbi:Hypothetical_protein [Hexamita inflata]|uniref:Hypothetical_protein n=1 Tax=Hexamita inflata TaxID=28002 RepID=A0AA86V067_9EUKA|nr:Hypothetical protein HINF_LOCUS58742 [Hexamita inflata]